jgi:4-hydroxyphenylacetate 3-monooxygenase
MLRSGADYVASLRDGRRVYLGRECVTDVTVHPAFREAVQSMARFYDFKAAPENRDVHSFEADGERHSVYFLQARDRDGLMKRTMSHKALADLSYGLFGRSPDYVASLVTGMAIKPDVFGAYAGNLERYYRFMRGRDLFAAHAVIPPQAARDPKFYLRQNKAAPSCRVVREDDDGVVIAGMKMLATGAVLADEIWIGNILPLSPEAKAEAITVAVACNAPGLTLWSRKGLPRDATSHFDNPLTWQFDETDSMVLFDDVKIPWERVFVHNEPTLSRELYIKTPSHVYANHQANVRFWSKMQLIVGLASRVSQANGAADIPAVRDLLGRFATMEAQIAGMIMGQIMAAETWGNYCAYNRRYMYGAMNWCADHYASIIENLRELSGGGPLQMPADISVMEEPALAATFEALWDTPQMGAVARMKLFKLVWDLVGSEFAGRHLQYERFFGGATFIQRANSYREAPWGMFDGIVDDLMARYDVPAATPARKASPVAA